MKRKLLFVTITAALTGSMTYMVISLKIKRDNLFSKPFKNDDLVFFDFENRSIYPLRSNEAVALVKFHSDCEHCHNEIKELDKNSGLFKPNTVFFVSDEQAGAVEKVDSLYSLSRKGVFKILCDSLKICERKFGNRITPMILLFDKSGTLVKEYTGEVSARLLAANLKDR